MRNGGMREIGVLLLAVSVAHASDAEHPITASLRALPLPEIVEAKSWAIAPSKVALPIFSDLATGTQSRATTPIQPLPGNETLGVPSLRPGANGLSNQARFGLGGSSNFSGVVGADHIKRETIHTTSAAAVPLPSAGVLGLVGLAAVATRRRR
jgi:MYXO-CTERM domain-containing protein